MYDHSNVLFYVNILEKYRIYKDIKRIHIYILIYFIIKIKLYHCDLHVHADKYWNIIYGLLDTQFVNEILFVFY